MRILFLTHSFNSLTQRLYTELAERGHELSVEFDIHEQVSAEAVALFRPDLILAPFLRRAIPESIWRHHLCLVVHPGIRGDRGPSSLDWAIMEGRSEWGVTVLQANAEMDGGEIWAGADFPMRAAAKGSLYRHEVTEAAVEAVLTALARVQGGLYAPESVDPRHPGGKGRWHPLMSQSDRAIDWARDDAATVLRKIRAADSTPGVLDTLFGEQFHLYGAHPEDTLRGTAPGAVIAQRHGAICRATIDGAVWITHLKRYTPGEPALKLPAAMLLGERLRGVPESSPSWSAGGRTYREIRYEEQGGVGYLHFEFHNGAMSSGQCRRLLDAYRHACGRDTLVIVLMGGHDFWSNGIHLNCIEAADSPADESWRNINAVNDLARAVITTGSHLTIAALQGNAGAGGVFLALAADYVFARDGVILNPHYKGMGNLYGSEYWTYLLPLRVGRDAAAQLTENRLPLNARMARRLGLIDDSFEVDSAGFRGRVRRLAEALTEPALWSRLRAQKNARRARDEREKPLETYRSEELAQMQRNFYGFDPSYHVARYHYVYKLSHAWTPLHLAEHRRQPRPVTASQPAAAPERVR